jgi:hypothetical protein
MSQYAERFSPKPLSRDSPFITSETYLELLDTVNLLVNRVWAEFGCCVLGDSQQVSFGAA